MKIAVELQPATGSPPDVEYTWDPDTDILSAQLSRRLTGDGMSGSVGLEGSDGSWLILDVSAGRINGLEIAVWPDVRSVSAVNPPPHVEDAEIVVPVKEASADKIQSLEVDTRLVAEADPARRNFHFTVGKARGTRTIRLARDFLIDIDEKRRISGVWLLNVPPCPEDS